MIFNVIQDKKLLLSIGSIIISIVVLYLKYLAWYTTNSVAFYSDMLETLINVAAAIFGFIALLIAARPADEDHPYGHHKAEYLSAAAEGLLIVVTATLIIYESWQAWQHPRMPDAPFIGIIWNGSAGIVNLVWSLVLIKTGKRLCSPTLIAGGQHILSDVWTTIGLISGFLLIPFLHFLYLDAVLGFLIALNVLRMGFHVIKEAIDGLMDKAPPPSTIEQIYKIVEQNAPEALEFHMMRFRKVGAVLFIDFHLVLPGNMNVYCAHQICDRIEHALKQSLGFVSINIHVEPEEEKKINLC